MDVQGDLERFRATMKAFKTEQESILLNMSAGRKKMSSNNTSFATPFNSSSSNNNNGRGSKNDLSKVLETDIILSPLSQTTGGRNKWPHALVANFEDKCADLGFMESNGAVWKLTKVDGTFEGTRVVLQTAEIGQADYFLTTELDLALEKARAAIFSVRSPAPSATSATSSSSSSVFSPVTMAAVASNEGG